MTMRGKIETAVHKSSSTDQCPLTQKNRGVEKTLLLHTSTSNIQFSTSLKTPALSRTFPNQRVELVFIQERIFIKVVFPKRIEICIAET